MQELHFSECGDTYNTGKEQKMSIGQITGWAIGIIGFLSLFIEVSKIKINPISALLKWIGSKASAQLIEKIDSNQKETNKRLDGIERKQEELEKKIEELSLQEAIDVADSIKTQIFSFYHELQKPGIRHSEAEFNQIIALNEKYERLVERTKQQNGVYEAEFKYIMQVFHQCQETNDFDLRGKNNGSNGKGKNPA